jgi:putative cardiolipin synthase
MNFADLDVVVIGPVVKEVSDQFDLYWNNQSAIPIAAMARQTTTPEQFTAKRAALVAHHETAKASAYAQSLRDSEFARQLRNHSVSYDWGKATIVNDHPDKVATSAKKTETHLAPQLRELADKTKRELFLVSPYFVPGKEGVALLAAVRQPRTACGRDHQFARVHRRGAGPLQIPALPQAADRSRRRTL